MKKLIAVFIFLLSTTLSFAQIGPKIKFMAKDNTIDYGLIKKREDDGVRVFEFENTGDQPLIINNVKSNCGCLVFTKPDYPIMPGKRGKIVVKYKMTVGLIRKTFLVDTNAVNAENDYISLRIKGEVLEK